MDETSDIRCFSQLSTVLGYVNADDLLCKDSLNFLMSANIEVLLQLLAW